MADDETAALVPTVTKPVDFYGEELMIALAGDASYVALRPICDYLGLAWNGQYQRIQRDTVLKRHTRIIAMTGADGRQREMVSLQLDYLPGWLFGVTSSRLRPELVEKLTHYREECFQVLWRAYQAELTESTSIGDAALATTTRTMQTTDTTLALAQVRDLALAIAAMAEQQIALQEQMGGFGARLDRAAVLVGDLQRRVSMIEAHTTPVEAISDEQAAEIAAQVKALAELLTERDASKNHYQGIFAELYRRFGASSYKLLRLGQYRAVLAFLEDWRQAAQQGK